MGSKNRLLPVLQLSSCQPASQVNESGQYLLLVQLADAQFMGLHVNL